MFGKSDTEKSAATTTPNDAYWQFEAAYREYFQDVQTIWLETQKRLRALHADYERAMIRATDEAEMREIFNKFGRQFLDGAEEWEPTPGHMKAYEKHKAAMQKALASAAAEHLDPATMADLGQSLSIVASLACTLAGGRPVTASERSTASK